jgi:hypothetical protein
MAKDRFRLVEDDDGLFVERNGKRIAKRGVGRHMKVTLRHRTPPAGAAAACKVLSKLSCPRRAGEDRLLDLSR